MDIINSKLLIEKSLEFNKNQEEEAKESLKFQFEQTDNLNETIKAKRRECKVNNYLLYPQFKNQKTS
jgi:hypothetical protein